VLPFSENFLGFPPESSIEQWRKAMASILIRAMTEGDHGFYAPAWNKSGTLRPGFAKGKHEPFAEFAYYVRWTEGGKRHVQCVGKDPAVAIMAMR